MIVAHIIFQSAAVTKQVFPLWGLNHAYMFPTPGSGLVRDMFKDTQ